MFDDIKPKLILFDFYGTLVHILTDEHSLQPWFVLTSYLRYQGARITAEELRGMYFDSVQERLDGSPEPYPEVNIIPIFRDILARLEIESSECSATTLLQLFRSLSIKEFQLFPETLEVLQTLSKKFRLGLLSDSQEVYIKPELQFVSLDSFFDSVVISSQYGYRKPDPRLFQQALKEMGLRTSDNVLYIGDNWGRDIVGASKAGIQPVWIQRNGEQVNVPHDQSIPVISDLRELLCLID